MILYRYPVTPGDPEVPTISKLKVGFSMEPESVYPEYSAKKLIQKHGASQHYSWDATFPFTYFDYQTYDGIRKNTMHLVNPWEKRLKKGVFIARNCNSTSGREYIVEALIAEGLADSVSDCLRNRDWLGGSKADVMSKYMFYFAFENSHNKDYVTEKAYQALSSGNVPVYIGAPNAKDGFFPHTSSVIFFQDYKTIGDLMEYLNLLVTSKHAWMKHQNWRRYDSAWDKRFYERMLWTKYHKDCRLCEYAWAKKHRLGWNIKYQDIIYPQTL